ncbi:hypothetical protein BJV78DRAFT_1251206, partial [Lactifluus subvellereus]
MWGALQRAARPTLIFGTCSCPHHDHEHPSYRGDYDTDFHDYHIPLRRLRFHPSSTRSSLISRNIIFTPFLGGRASHA